jgi:hypothetical protein
MNALLVILPQNEKAVNALLFSVFTVSFFMVRLQRSLGANMGQSRARFRIFDGMVVWRLDSSRRQIRAKRC